MADVKYNDALAVQHSFQTEPGDGGGGQTRPVHGLPAAVATDIANTASRLSTIITSLSTLTGHVDGLEGFVDGLETLATALDGHVDGLEGFVDGLEGFVDGLEGFLDGVETKLDSIIAGIPVTSVPAPNSSGPFRAAGTIGASTTQLGSQALKHGIRIYNLSSTETIYWGPSGTDNTNGAPIYPLSDSGLIPVANSNQIYIYGTGSNPAYRTAGT